MDFAYISTRFLFYWCKDTEYLGDIKILNVTKLTSWSYSKGCPQSLGIFECLCYHKADTWIVFCVIIPY